MANPAAEAFRKCSADLIRGIQDHDLPLLSWEFYAAGAVPKSVVEEVNLMGWGLSPEEKKTKLLSAVGDKVDVEPDKFQVLLRALKKLPRLIDVANRLETTYKDCGSMLAKPGEGTFSYTGKPQEFELKRSSLKMYFPRNALPSNVKECQVHVKASPSVDFLLPESTKLVSGLYLIHCPVKHVNVKVQHCATQYSSLAFVGAEFTPEETGRKHCYQLKILEGESFPQDARYGSIQLYHSHSIVGIVSEQQPPLMTESVRRYLARLYYSSSGVHSWNVYFVIMWNLDVLIAAVDDEYAEMNAISGPTCTNVTFEKEEIILEFGKEESGWRITPNAYPNITKQQVDDFASIGQAPSCQLYVEWCGQLGMPKKLMPKVTLQGAKKPSNWVRLHPPTSEDRSEPKFMDRERRSVMRQIDPINLHIQRTNKTTMEAVWLFARQVVLILHACNENEYWAALEKLEPPTKEDGSEIRDRPIIYPRIGSVIGWFAGYKAAVVRTRQGNECHDELITALTGSFPNSKVIIGAGIAYANDRRRKFADVLISDQIENFVQYKKEGDEITIRGPREEIDPNVQRIFENPARDWTDMQSFPCANNNRASVAHIGCIVSAPTLIGDRILREQLMKHTPHAIGGEMEGWALLELKRTLKDKHNKYIEVIVIKGVADYGDLSKEDKWQWTAAKAAMDCIHYCLEKSGGIEFNAYPPSSYQLEPQPHPQEPPPQQPYPQQTYSQRAYSQQPCPHWAYLHWAYPQQPYPQHPYPQQPYPQQPYPAQPTAVRNAQPSPSESGLVTDQETPDADSPLQNSDYGPRPGPCSEQQLQRMANRLTVDDISEFLTKIKLGHYVQLFTDNDVDGRLLLKLTDDDLKDLGVDNGFHRRKIITKFEAHILELINKQEQ